MNKIGLIIKREYLRRVSKKSFLLLTFLTPFLFAALVFVPLWLSTIKGDDVKQVAIRQANTHRCLKTQKNTPSSPKKVPVWKNIVKTRIKKFSLS